MTVFSARGRIFSSEVTSTEMVRTTAGEAAAVCVDSVSQLTCNGGIYE